MAADFLELLLTPDDQVSQSDRIQLLQMSLHSGERSRFGSLLTSNIKKRAREMQFQREVLANILNDLDRQYEDIQRSQSPINTRRSLDTCDVLSTIHSPI